MNSFKEFLKEDTQILTEMSNLRKNQTGLPVNIWVDDIGVERKSKHNQPRIKFQNDNADRMHEETISMSISENPEILQKNQKINISNEDVNKIKKFVKLNKNVLIEYWNQNIELLELFKRIKKI